MINFERYQLDISECPFSERQKVVWDENIKKYPIDEYEYECCTWQFYPNKECFIGFYFKELTIEFKDCIATFADSSVLEINYSYISK